VEDLAVVDAVVWVARLVEFAKEPWRQTLEQNSKRPHDFAMTHHDNASVRLFAMLGIKNLVQAHYGLGNRLTAGRTPPNTITPTPSQIGSHRTTPAFLGGSRAGSTPIALREHDVGEPLRTWKVHTHRGFHGSNVPRGQIAGKPFGKLPGSYANYGFVKNLVYFY
jgi:hypothetical protein